MTNNDWKNLILSVGSSHFNPRPCSPIEVALLINKARFEENATVKEIAERCHIGPSMISKFSNLLKIPKDYWHLIDWGNCDSNGLISFTSGQAVAQHDEVIQRKILDAKLKYGFNKDQIYFLGQRIKTSGLTIEECIDESVKRRQGPSILFWLLLGGYDKDTQGILSNLSQLEKDSILLEFFQKYYPMANIIVKSKSNGFSIIIKKKEVFDEFNSIKELIEKRVNEFICQTKL